MEEELEAAWEGYGAMSEACQSLIQTLSKIKRLAERTDAPAGDMLYEIVCQAEAALEAAPTWAEAGEALPEEKEPPAHLSVILTGDVRQGV